MRIGATDPTLERLSLPAVTVCHECRTPYLISHQRGPRDPLSDCRQGPEAFAKKFHAMKMNLQPKTAEDPEGRNLSRCQRQKYKNKIEKLTANRPPETSTNKQTNKTKSQDPPRPHRERGTTWQTTQGGSSAKPGVPRTNALQVAFHAAIARRSKNKRNNPQPPKTKIKRRAQARKRTNENFEPSQVKPVSPKAAP